MEWDFLEVLEVIADVLSFPTSSSKSSNLNYDDKSDKNKRIKYLTEKWSVGFIVTASILLLFVFKDPLPTENYFQTLIVIFLIGMAISFLLFFILYHLELYHFKNFSKLLLFSCSVILFFISIVLYVYFKSGIFI